MTTRNFHERHLAIKIPFMLLLLFTLANAVDLIGCTGNVMELINATAGPTLATITMFMAILIAFIYMIGTGFSKPEFLVLAKDEGFHMVISTMLFLMFGGMMVVSCGMMQSAFEFAYSNMTAGMPPGFVDPCNSIYAGNPVGVTTQELSSCYSSAMKADAAELITRYTNKEIELQIDASEMVSYSGLLGGVSYAPSAYKRSWAGFVETIRSMFIVPAYVSIMAQDMFVQFFIGSTGEMPSGDYGPVVMVFLIPVAFIFRFFAPMRQIGNMMIAVSVGIYLIIPLFIALNGMMYMYIFTREDCTNYYSSIVSDTVLGDCTDAENLLSVARLYPNAFLLPNLTIVAFITFIASTNKALKVLT